MKPLVKPFLPEYNKIFERLAKVFDSGYLAEGEEVYEFETRMKSLLNVDYCLAVNSGTSALHLALLINDVGLNDEVISTPLTAEPTNTVIKNVGAKVIFADIDPQNGLISPESIESKITAKTKAIMIVHYAGMVCDMDKINIISKKYNIPVIEDAAHAFMSKYEDKYIGSNSRTTIFSFQAIKHLTTIDGGLLTLKNKEDYERAKKLRWFGLTKDKTRLQNNITEAGFKYNMNNICAAIGNVQLDYLNENVNKYIENGLKLDRELQNIPGLTMVKYNDNTQPSYWLYTILVDRREDFILMMEKAGFLASPLHLRNDRHFVFGSKEKYPNLDYFYERFVHIPCGWWMTDEDMDKMILSIKRGW